ncbi:unnamed protein product, partial [Trichogramma brassicae]
MQDPNEDTQWNDILRAKGIIPEKKKEAEVTEDQIVDLLENTINERTGRAQKDLENATLDELDELEDEEDEKVLQEFRAKRIAEWKALVQKNKYGDVYEISAQDYVQEVNKAPEGTWVILHLYKQGCQSSENQSQDMNQMLFSDPLKIKIKRVNEINNQYMINGINPKSSIQKKKSKPTPKLLKILDKRRIIILVQRIKPPRDRRTPATAAAADSTTKTRNKLHRKKQQRIPRHDAYATHTYSCVRYTWIASTQKCDIKICRCKLSRTCMLYTRMCARLVLVTIREADKNDYKDAKAYETSCIGMRSSCNRTPYNPFRFHYRVRRTSSTAKYGAASLYTRRIYSTDGAIERCALKAQKCDVLAQFFLAHDCRLEAVLDSHHLVRLKMSRRACISVQNASTTRFKFFRLLRRIFERVATLSHIFASSRRRGR